MVTIAVSGLLCEVEAMSGWPFIFFISGKKYGVTSNAILQFAMV